MLPIIINSQSELWREKEALAAAEPPPRRLTLVGFRSWYALHVRSSQERLVTDKLIFSGVEAFYPFYTVRSRDARRDVEKKFFPGYVFVSADLERWNLSAAGIPQIVAIVGLGPGRPLSIPASEIEAVRILAKSTVASLSVPCPFLKEGEAVRVKHGPLRDVTGFVIRGHGKDRLIISIEALGQSRSVDIDRNDVERFVEAPAYRLDKAA